MTWGECRECRCTKPLTAGVCGTCADVLASVQKDSAVADTARAISKKDLPPGGPFGAPISKRIPPVGARVTVTIGVKTIHPDGTVIYAPAGSMGVVMRHSKDTSGDDVVVFLVPGVGEIHAMPDWVREGA
jgi:hypothetical protein